MITTSFDITSYLFLVFLNIFSGPHKGPGMYPENLGDIENTITLYMQPSCSLTWLAQPPCPFTPSNTHQNLTKCSHSKGLCWTSSSDIPASIKVICPDCRYGVHIDLLKSQLSPVGIYAVNDARCDHRLPRNAPRSYQQLRYKDIFRMYSKGNAKGHTKKHRPNR